MNVHSSPEMKKNIRKRTVFRLVFSFESVCPNTHKITTDVLAELTTYNSRSSIIVDSFEGVWKNQDAASGYSLYVLLIVLLSVK